MRVLFVTHNVPRFANDAAGSFVLQLAVALQSLGHRVSVLAPGGAGLAANDSIGGVAITRVRYASDAHMTLAYTGTMAEAVKSSWSGRFALVGLLRALRQATTAHIRAAERSNDPFDIVHAHWWFPSALALWGVLPRRKPALVITMHGSDVRLAQGAHMIHPVMRRVLRYARRRTAVSTWKEAA